MGVIINTNPREIILNRISDDVRSVFNLLGLIIKQYVYHKRCMNSKFSAKEVFKEIDKIHSMELFNAKRNSQMCTFLKKWGQINHELIKKYC